MEVGLVTQNLSVRRFWGRWEHVPSAPPPPTPSFLWPPSWSWRLWLWDFPSLLPGAVTHKTQGICPESPFFRAGLGVKALLKLIPRII